SVSVSVSPREERSGTAVEFAIKKSSFYTYLFFGKRPRPNQPRRHARDSRAAAGGPHAGAQLKVDCAGWPAHAFRP
ncbi:MAG TPA: hypothetical protein PKA88_32650, partial [Polyangiaceae bacterium]|nr:hypothetical protein [Polyangiaceae bacterium]